MKLTNFIVMSSKQQAATMPAEKALEKTNGQTRQVAKRPEDQLLGMFDDLDRKEEGVEMVSEYHEFIEGENKRIIIMGMAKIKSAKENDDSLVPAIRFAIANEGEVKFCISADAVFVSSLSRFAEQVDAAPFNDKPTFAFSVTMKGWKGERARQYRDFSIKPLN